MTDARRHHPHFPARTKLAWGLAAALGVASCLAALLAPAVFLRGYLLAWTLWLGAALGAFGWLCVHHLVDGRWGAATRPLLIAATRTLPLLALLFLPIALGINHLYPWTDPRFMAVSPARLARAAYLEPTGFYLRSAVALLGWCLLSRPLLRPGPLRPGAAARALIFYFITITTAAVDWLLSLDPDMSTSAVGFELLAGNGVAGLAVILLAALAWRPRARLAAARVHDLGNLLLSALMLWAYVAFSQFLLIWSADLPRETAWYILRAQRPWSTIGWLLVVLHFALPFALLLLRPIKRRLPLLAGVAALLLMMRAVELAWWISPGRSLVHLWIDPLIVLGLGAAWFGYFWFALARTPTEVADV